MNLDLFSATDESVEFPISLRSNEEPDDRATRRIRDVLLGGHPAVLSFSAGKDSSCLVSIALMTARLLIEQGHICPPIVVLHSTTLVEQPEIVDLAEQEMAKMQVFAKQYGIPLHIRIGVPTINASFPPRVIGGRALPSFPGGNSDCTQDWKIAVNERSMASVFKMLGKTDWKEPVVMTGVRSSESVVRDQRISKRGEVAEGIWRNELGKLRLSPILDFQEEDVWQHIGLANAGVIQSYSDFEDTMRIYRASGGDSCVIVADMKGAASKKPCGVRTGCWVCTRVAEDKSMNQMIASDTKRYGHLKPLAKLRDFISRTQYDWSLRNYVWRSIDDEGYITIGADAYSPAMLERLLRYTLSAELLSGVRIISMAQLIAIDARWSLYGLHPPFTALKIYKEVIGGAIEEAPEVPRYPATPAPKIGKIKVGSPTYSEALRGQVHGLRNLGAELFSESCGYELKTLKNGELVIDCEPKKTPSGEDEDDEGLEVDEEAAELFLEFLADDYIREYCRADCSDWSWGFKTYIEVGTIKIHKGGSRMTHEILMRTQWRQKMGLHGQQDAEKLAERCDVLFATQLALI